MRVIVTGGAGYIGSVTVERLLQRGDAVVVLDNLWRGHRAAVPTGADFVAVDLRSGDDLAAIVRSFRPDAIIHFAAAVVALSWITLGVLVGKDAADGTQHRGADKVLGRDQLDSVALTPLLVGDGLNDG